MTSALFVVDAGPGVGFGHFRRSSFLLREFRARGIDCRMIVPGDAALSGVADEPLGIWPKDLAKAEAADIIVADSYRIELPIMQAWRGRYGLRLMIDDNADRPLDSDFVLNHNIYAPSLDYGRVCSCPVLAGLEFCLIDPRFAALRDRPPAGDTRVVVSFGGTDTVKGPATAAAILNLLPDARIDVVVPATPPDGGVPTAPDGRITLLVRPDMVTAMSGGTIYAGAAGVTTWEAAAAGLSIVVCRIADNQDRMIPALRAAGIRALDRFDAEGLAEGVAAEARKGRPDNPLAHIIDGRGSARAADRVLGS